MLDGAMRKIIDPPLGAVGRVLARWGISANAMTLAGLVAGLFGALSIAIGTPSEAIWLILLSRVGDGLDGAIARATTKTDYGGYLDIAADFLFYGAIPTAFIIAEPAANAVPGAVLLLAFYFNCATFLGYSVMAERRRLTTSARGAKSLYFTGGLLEGTETVVFFVVICIWPGWFGPLAWLFALGTFITAIARLFLGWQVFGGSAGSDRR